MYVALALSVLIRCWVPGGCAVTGRAMRAYGFAAVQPVMVFFNTSVHSSGSKSPTIASAPWPEPRYSW